mmetsp:Transcript_120654/g.240255  ORF Transcript_120654/g.240255 Transcript_120654/m.240255 type:complete len:235 (+) Transcript_120654:1-705(+)
MKLVRDMQDNDDAHKNKLNLALSRQARQAQKREWQQLEAMKFVERRAAAAELRLAGIVTGSERQAAERRASVLAEEAAAAEQARKNLEETHRRFMEEANDREKQLQNALVAAEMRNNDLQALLEAATRHKKNIEAQLTACVDQIHASHMPPSAANSTLSIGTSQDYTSSGAFACPSNLHVSGGRCKNDHKSTAASQQHHVSPRSKRNCWIETACFAEQFGRLRHRLLSWLNYVV